MKRLVIIFLLVFLVLGCKKNNPMIVSDGVCSPSSDRVCIIEDTIEIRQGQFGIFGIEIFNILGSQDFQIEVSRPSPSGYSKNNKEMYIDMLEWKPKIRSIYILSNETKKIGLGVLVPENAELGTYVFNVNVNAQDGSPYIFLQKLYVKVTRKSWFQKNEILLPE